MVVTAGPLKISFTRNVPTTHPSPALGQGSVFSSVPLMMIETSETNASGVDENMHEQANAPAGNRAMNSAVKPATPDARETRMEAPKVKSGLRDLILENPAMQEADFPLLSRLFRCLRLPAQHRLARRQRFVQADRKSTRLNSSHSQISYAVFCLKKKKK